MNMHKFRQYRGRPFANSTKALSRPNASYYEHGSGNPPVNSRASRLGLMAFLILIQWPLSSCAVLDISARVKTAEVVQIPFIRNSANECYYLDEFMPMPDGMVTGKSGNLNLRYYNYKAASYKDWTNNQIILSFYSSDNRCWSLFEEYYMR